MTTENGPKGGDGRVAPRPKHAVLPGDTDGHVVGIRRDQVRQPVLVEIHDGQVHRILAGGNGPRDFEAAVALAVK